MKNVVQTKTTNFRGISKLILTISTSICAILLCSSVFIFSINKASANDTKEFNFPDKLTNKDISAINNSGGKYYMSLTSATDSDGSLLWYILAWDTHTGRSKFYYGTIDKGLRLAQGKFQLPSNPTR